MVVAGVGCCWWPGLVQRLGIQLDSEETGNIPGLAGNGDSQDLTGVTVGWETANNWLKINRFFFFLLGGETAPCELQLLGGNRELLESCEGEMCVLRQLGSGG